MPRIKSAQKRLRQTKARTGQNRMQRSRLRNAIKKVRQAQDPEAKAKAFQEAERLLDRAGRKNLVHRNAAARQKSRLRKLVG